MDKKAINFLRRKSWYSLHNKIIRRRSTMENRKDHLRKIVVEATATSLEKWRKQVIAGQPETGRLFAFISDEGNYVPGGEGTAPTPLTYFVSGMAL